MYSKSTHGMSGGIIRRGMPYALFSQESDFPARYLRLGNVLTLLNLATVALIKL